MVPPGQANGSQTALGGSGRRRPRPNPDEPGPGFPGNERPGLLCQAGGARARCATGGFFSQITGSGSAPRREGAAPDAAVGRGQGQGEPSPQSAGARSGSGAATSGLGAAASGGPGHYCFPRRIFIGGGRADQRQGYARGGVDRISQSSGPAETGGPGDSYRPSRIPGGGTAPPCQGGAPGDACGYPANGRVDGSSQRGATACPA